MDENLITYLSEFISENRKAKFLEVLSKRTRHLSVVMEDIYQAHNTSAVLRSCDCFGVQDVHIIENRNKYNINPDVALGSFKWLSLIRHNQEANNTLSCLRSLKENGYRIVATTPHTNDCLIEDLDISQKTALVFGTELEGISDTVRSMADAYVRIPMYGFTESFNISVSAAICLHTLVQKLHRSDTHWQLSEPEKKEILYHWIRNTISKPDLIEAEYQKRKKT